MGQINIIVIAFLERTNKFRLANQINLAGHSLFIIQKNSHEIIYPV